MNMLSDDLEDAATLITQLQARVGELEKINKDLDDAGESQDEEINDLTDTCEKLTADITAARERAAKVEEETIEKLTNITSEDENLVWKALRPYHGLDERNILNEIPKDFFRLAIKAIRSLPGQEGK